MKWLILLLTFGYVGALARPAEAGNWYFRGNVQDVAVGPKWYCTVDPYAGALSFRTVVCKGLEIPFQRIYDMHEVTRCGSNACSSSCKCGVTRIGVDNGGRYFVVATDGNILKQSDDKSTWIFETSLPVSFDTIEAFAVTDQSFTVRKDFWVRAYGGATFRFDGAQRVWFYMGERAFLSNDAPAWNMFSGRAASPWVVDMYWEPGGWVPASADHGLGTALWFRNGNLAVGYGGSSTVGVRVDFRAFAARSHGWYQVYNPANPGAAMANILPNGGRILKLLTGAGRLGFPSNDMYANAWVITSDLRLYTYESTCESQPC